MKLFHHLLSLPTLFFFFFFFFCFLQETVSIGPLQLTHPFDPLTKQEITLIQTIVLNKYPTKTNHVKFHYVGLDDPEKATVLKWVSTGAATTRNAFVIAIINSQVHELTINLRSSRVLSDKIHSGNGFPTLTVDEQSDALQLPFKHGPFVESIKKRGLNLSEVVCSGFTVGWYGETQSNKRVLRIECFMKEETANIYVRPINGITILADLEQMKIIDYHDNAVEPVPKAENTEYRASHLKPPFGPRLHSFASYQPDGSGFTIKGHSVRYISK